MTTHLHHLFGRAERAGDDVQRARPDLVEVPLQQARGQVVGAPHQLEEAHVVVGGERHIQTQRRLNLGRVAYRVAVRLGLPVAGKVTVTAAYLQLQLW